VTTHAALRSAAGTGAALCLISAAAYSSVPVLGKLGFDEGLSVPTLLVGRFCLAAAVLWLLALRFDARPSRRGLVTGIVLGLVFYAGQNGFFFAALQRISATLATLLVFIAPVLVAVAAVALGRERLSPGQVAAIPLSLAGLALVLLGGSGVGEVDAYGVLLALGCAVLYSAYMLIIHAVVANVPPLTLSASVITGGLLPFLAVAALTAEPAVPSTGDGWAIVLTMAVVGTVLPVAALTAGTALSGPSTATVLSASQPALTAGLAIVVLGETLTALQVLGGALVLGSVVVVQARWPLRSPEPNVGGGP
jgi:drug/metabolite transporter (DMT)-like permease